MEARFRSKRVRLIALAFGVVVLFLVPMAVSQANHATFAVDYDLDEPDNNPGDGICATANDDCTLRAAVEEANAHAGADTITLPAGTYNVDPRLVVTE